MLSPFSLLNWRAAPTPSVGLLSGAVLGSYLDVVSLTPHCQLRALRQCDGRPLRLPFGVALSWALVCGWPRLTLVDYGPGFNEFWVVLKWVWLVLVGFLPAPVAVALVVGRAGMAG